MKMYSIEIDENVWTHLQKHAEPFVDTPNTVLNRLLFGYEAGKKSEESVFKIPSVSVLGTPKSLSQILEVLYEMEVNGYTRTQATNRVARKRGTTPQTIIDKYCRQLNKRAHEVDAMLSEPGYVEFRELLKKKFRNHREMIDTYFDTLLMGA